MGLVGLGLFLFTDLPVDWSGFIAMVFFYAAIFFLGTYVGKRRLGDTTLNGVMLAGRSVPLWIAVFTMGATWVGGGYINGTAEFTAAEGSGLVWVQAPWGMP
jgi:high affinity choline transporter 7